MPRRRSQKTPPAAADESTEPDVLAAETGDDERRLSGRLDIGVFSVELPGEWRFYPLEDRLACRPMSGVGLLQITPAANGTLTADATHEMLMAAAKQASGYEIHGPGVDKAKEIIDSGRAGGESFIAGRDYVRVWYHLRPEGLILAWFACPRKRIAERSVARLIGQCDRIIASLRLSPIMHG